MQSNAVTLLHTVHSASTGKVVQRHWITFSHAVSSNAAMSTDLFLAVHFVWSWLYLGSYSFLRPGDTWEGVLLASSESPAYRQLVTDPFQRGGGGGGDEYAGQGWAWTGCSG